MAFDDCEYEGTLSSLTRYGTMNTPSLKTQRERKGKAHLRHNPRLSDKSLDTTVTVYHIDKQDERYEVDASFYSRKRSSTEHKQHTSNTSSEARAIQQAQADYRAMLRARVAGNEAAL